MDRHIPVVVGQIANLPGRLATCPTRSALAIALAMVLEMLACAEQPARAAEFRLRAQCTCTGPVVTLGDVAEVVAPQRQQAAALAAIELFPAPPASQQRFVRLREIQDLLLLRGINLSEHQFSGSSQVTVQGGGEPARPEPEQSRSASVSRRAKRIVGDAVVQYLRKKASADRHWLVELELDAAQTRAVLVSGKGVSLSGGAAPWTGAQRFEVTVDTPDGPRQFPVVAQVSEPPAVVVTNHALGRGTVIRETDVALQSGAAPEGESNGCCSLEEVVGKETTRAIAAGKVVPQDALRAPLMVRRGEVVTVYARSPGIQIRTTARARDDGSLGDLIAVESLSDRRAYFARVCAVREAEIYARSIRADQADSGGTSHVVRR